MPTQPEPWKPAYWTHNFDLGKWRLVERYENGEGLFEPIEENWDKPRHPMTPESRRRHYWISSMDAH